MNTNQDVAVMASLMDVMAQRCAALKAEEAACDCRGMCRCHNNRPMMPWMGPCFRCGTGLSK